MSGPKCDEYTLALQERERQRQAYLAKLAKEQEEARKRAERARLLAEQKAKEEAERKRINDFDAQAEDTMQELIRLQEEKLMKRFYEAYAEYEAAAVVAGETPEKMSFDTENAQEMLDFMEEETKRLQETELEAMCQAEVYRIFQETLGEMGYDVIAEKRSKKTGAVLYKYDDETAIQVLNSGKQFVMEVVAVDDVDRRVSADEADELLDHMGAFCVDYQRLRDKIEADGRLSRKGIYHRQPDKKYARVINRQAYSEKKTDRYHRDTTGENGSAKAKNRRTN